RIKYKKAPQAPRRFKSSYIFFSTIKHKSIRVELLKANQDNAKLSTTEIAKMVSKAWKTLPEDEREKWEEMARKDKVRYETEKSLY
ncbi:non-histone protein, partial [Fragilariopsis cylindrus CCMP1102]